MIGAMTAGTDSRPSLTSAPPSPPATRHVPRPWKDPRLVVGVALVALSVLVGARLLATADDTVAVWAARTALRVGQPVGPADLVRREIRFGSQAEADRYVSAASAIAPGTVLRREVGAGELLPRAAVTGKQGAAVTEVPLSVATEAVPATVRVGSVVDVWVSPDPGTDSTDARTRATLVFDDVTVVSAPRAGTTLGPSATRQVIVGVSGAQEESLPEALAQLSRGTVLLTRQH